MGLVAGVAALSGCDIRSDLGCQTDEQCIPFGEGGQCEVNNFCSFPDQSCPEGRRWHDRAGALANQCVMGLQADGEGDGESGAGQASGDESGSMWPEPATTGETLNGSTSADVGDDGDASTTGSTTGTDATTTSTTTGTTTSTTTGTTDTGMMALSCADFSGTAGYMLCDESATTCHFAHTAGESCEAICSAQGLSCMAAQSNDGGGADPLGECENTGQCRDMYPGADDCSNAMGGICLCGGEVCANMGNTDPCTSSGNLECTAASDSAICTCASL